MSSVGKYDEILFGAFAGLLIAFPSVTTTVHNFLDDVIPSSWDWLGSTTAPVLIIAIGALIGLIVSKTK